VPSGYPDKPIKTSTLYALEMADEHLESYCKKEKISLKVLPIGIPEKAKTGVGPAQMWINWPERKEEGHKGDHGHLTIVGGSEDFFGAPIIAGLGAIRSGVDLIEVFTAPKYLKLAQKVLPELILHTYKHGNISLGDIEGIKESIDRSSAVLIGPGLVADKDELHEILGQIISYANSGNIPIILDAGALVDITKYPREISDWTITPHAGEWDRIVKNLSPELQKDPVEVAQKFNINILKKDAIDEVYGSDGSMIYNYTGNAILTKGGTGDMLSGLVAGLQAQGVSGFVSAQLSAFALGCAGDELVEVLSSAFTIDELSVTLGRVITKFTK